MTSRLPLFLLLFGLCLLAGACGGSSGEAPTPTPAPDDGGDDGNGGGGGGDPEAEAIRLILEDCASEALGATFDAAGLFHDVLTGQGGTAGVVIDGSAVTGEGVFNAPFTLDTNADMEPDGNGFFSAEGPDGLPAAPFTEMELDPLRASGISELPALLGLLDGFVFVMQALTPELPSIDGRADALFTGGSPGDTAGDLTVAGMTGCQTHVTWSAVPAAASAAAVPTATFEVEIASGSDVVTGQVTTDGSQTATGTFSRNGGTEHAFAIDLMSGDVTVTP